MTKLIFTITTSFLLTTIAVAQTNTFPPTGSAGVGTTAPNISSILEVKSTSKGLLIPRMTKPQRDAISSPATGLLIYQTNNTPGFYYFNSSTWTPIVSQGANTTLSNLASKTAINASLQPGKDSSINLGSSTLRWNNIYAANLHLSNDANIHGLTVGLGGGVISGNTALGYAALYSNTSAWGNTAIGFSALYSNTSGVSNTANGYTVLYRNTTGYNNTADGYSALYSNTTGNSNTAIGLAALYSNTTGYYNTASGYSALYSNTSGKFNTAIGYSALIGNITGNGNTVIGISADVTSSNLSNAMALGYTAQVTASNKVQVGNSSVTVIGGQVGWSTFSDGRFKTNIKNNVPGLEFINGLNPITYTLQLRQWDHFLGKKDSLIHAMADEYTKGEKKIHTGFIAQEVEKAAQQINYHFDGVNPPQNDKDNYSLVYANFVPSLVKAVQQLSNAVDEKDAQINNLQQQLSYQQRQIDELKVMITGQPKISGNSQLVNLSATTLWQNVPNPVRHSTTIKYSIQGQYASAKLLITDKQGRALKEVNITSAKGSVKVDVSTLATGTYQYSLYADGKLLDSKSMMVEK